MEEEERIYTQLSLPDLAKANGVQLEVLRELVEAGFLRLTAGLATQAQLDHALARSRAMARASVRQTMSFEEICRSASEDQRLGELMFDDDFRADLRDRMPSEIKQRLIINNQAVLLGGGAKRRPWPFEVRRLRPIWATAIGHFRALSAVKQDIPRDTAVEVVVRDLLVPAESARSSIEKAISLAKVSAPTEKGVLEELMLARDDLLAIFDAAHKVLVRAEVPPLRGGRGASNEVAVAEGHRLVLALMDPEEAAALYREHLIGMPRVARGTALDLAVAALRSAGLGAEEYRKPVEPDVNDPLRSAIETRVKKSVKKARQK